MTTFKLFFNQNDIRRITKQVTSYEDFVTFLEELYPQFHMELLIKYDDKEGDRIAVTSQIEWDEMMEELRDEKIIKLYITEGPNPRGYFKDGPKPESLHFYTNEGTKEPSFDEHILNMLDENVTKCLGTFFRDGKIIPSGLPSFLKDVIGVKYYKENEVDMDVNISELGNVLHRKALDCMASLDKEVIQKGREYMNALVNLDPTNCLSLYNLACAEALLNRVPQALETLEKAIRNGYDNLEHMLEDKDFDNIRNSEGFVKLIELIGELQSSFVDEEDVDCENCNCEEECNNEHCGKIEGEKDCCDGTDNNCCGLLDNGCDEPVVLEYDSFQDSQFVLEKDVEESQKIETQVEPKVENKPTIEKSVEQLNNQLSESFIDLRSKWSAQITNLKNLGFTVDDEVLSLLIEQTNGNVEEVVSLLLSNN